MDAGVMSLLPFSEKSLLRPLLKPLLNSLVKELRRRAIKRKLRSRCRSLEIGYCFSEQDIDLYVHEQFTHLPSLTVDSADGDNGLVGVTIDGVRISWPLMLSPKDLPWLHHEIFDDFNINPSSYDHPSIDFESMRWVMDAGAAEGYFSVFALLQSPAQLIVVEPLALMKEALLKTMSFYNSGKEAVVVSAALSDKCGWSEIQVDYNHICDSALPLSERSIAPIKSERVAVTTIDQLASQYSLGAGGMIKMDIEGFEMAALIGAVHVMRNHKPALAIAVYHDLDNANKCKDIIRSANSNYTIEFRGCYGYFDPPRPYMVFAY